MEQASGATRNHIRLRRMGYVRPSLPRVGQAGYAPHQRIAYAALWPHTGADYPCPARPPGHRVCGILQAAA